MREWTERHIRELVDDEFKKLKKPAGGGDFEFLISSGRNEPSDFFYYDKNGEPVFFNEEDLNGIILFERQYFNYSYEYYNFKLIDERQYGPSFVRKTYELYDGILKFDDRMYEDYTNYPYLTSIPNGRFVTLALNVRGWLTDYWNGAYLSPFDNFDLYVYALQDNVEYPLSISGVAGHSVNFNRYLVDGEEYNVYSNGRTVIFKSGYDVWENYDYNKPAKIILESTRIINSTTP